ncbi:MAG: bifunctional DNA-formamidopyrimidine glycosylase/DNA-(apurinic or apyrimidinic site) lyase [Actinomycetota bacterium]|nr:bifunctional DNA-formamidopyrimidine glycosylase/DNA-(apurinic or apyrimidinic site) lyase [Actinomycetota bacterium]
MPELPEVEYLRRQLERALVGARITSCEILLPRLVTHPSPATYRRALQGRGITWIRRRGKYLIFGLDHGLEFVIHLGMTGSLAFSPPGEKRPRHTHIVYHLEDGRNLLYTDPRTFGETALVPRGDYRSLRGLHHMGPEPLSDDFTPQVLSSRLRGSCRIKSALLDQSRVAGIGNIYADEMLHRAGIHPLRRLDSIGPRETERLYRAMKEVLSDGIALGGSTISDYVDLEGERGNFQEEHRVYRREGLPCPMCGDTICRIRVGGRSSYFCPRCQR